jgi:hypothetical protein
MFEKMPQQSCLWPGLHLKSWMRSCFVPSRSGFPWRAEEGFRTHTVRRACANQFLRGDPAEKQDCFLMASLSCRSNSWMRHSHGNSGSLTSGDLVPEIVSPRMTASTALEQSHPVPEFPAHRLRAGVQLEEGPVEGLPKDGVRVAERSSPSLASRRVMAGPCPEIVRGKTHPLTEGWRHRSLPRARQ